MPKFDIWSEGFECTGNSGTATCHAKNIEAENFEEAVKKYFTKDNKLDSLVNLKNLTYWGCKLYQTEKEARKTFG